MVWGIIGFQKKVPLQFKCSVLSEHDWTTVSSLGYEMAELNWKLQQDNASIHVPKSTIAYFKERNIK